MSTDRLPEECPWSTYEGIERTYVRQRFRHGEAHHTTADQLLRGHEADWASQEAAGIPVYKRRYVLELRETPKPRKPRRKPGEFTRALVSVCGRAGTPRMQRTFAVEVQQPDVPVPYWPGRLGDR